MNIYNEKTQIILNILIGIFLALLISEIIYLHPSYEDQILKSNYELITKEKNNLGYSVSTIYVNYKPNPWGTVIGEFSFPIITHVSKSNNKLHSLFLKDMVYEIGIWRKNKLIEMKETSYLGSISFNDEYNEASNVVFLPKTQHTFNGLKNKYGLTNIMITGRIYNQTSGKEISTGHTTIQVFILYPYTRLFTFSILFLITFLKIYLKSD